MKKIFNKIIDAFFCHQKSKESFTVVEKPIELKEWCNQWKKELSLKIYIVEHSRESFTNLEDIVNYLKKNQMILFNKLMERIYPFYLGEQGRFCEDPDWLSKDEYDEALKNADMPKIHEVDELLNLIKPRCFWIDKKLNGVYPIKVEFDCTWDEEHGFDFIIYKGNVLSVEEMDELELAQPMQ